jgi:transposase-like protein
MKRYTPAEKQKLVAQIDHYRKSGLQVKAACEKAGISDVSYYLWKSQFKLKDDTTSEVKPETDALVEERFPVKLKPASKIREEDQTLVLEIKASFPHMGVKQLRQHLIRNHKITYSERQIRQLLEKRNVPKIRAAHENKGIRRFERDQPNEMWQIDIMQMYIGHQALYLTSFLDDYSRFIVSYTVSEHQKTEIILDLLGCCQSRRRACLWIYSG